MRLRTNLPATTRPLPKSGVIVYAGWLALLVGIEVLGRQAPNDFADAVLLSLFGLGMLFGWLYDPWHLLTKLTARFLVALRHVFSGARIHFGIDFQESSELPTGFPGWWRRVMIGMTICAAGLLFGSGAWFGDFRSWLVGGSYLIYLVLLGLLWSGLLAALAINGFLAFAIIHDFCVESYDGNGLRPLRDEIGWLGGCLVGALGGTFLLGSGIPLCLYLAGAMVWVVSFPVCPIGFSVQWTQRVGEPLQRFDGRWLWCQWALLFLGTLSLIALSCTDRLWQIGAFPQDTAMPVTLFFGTLLSWIGLATLVTMLMHRLRMVWLTYQMAARDSQLPKVFFTGRLQRAERAGLRTVFRKWGWAVRFTAPPAKSQELHFIIRDEQLQTWRTDAVWYLNAELIQSFCGVDRLQQGKRRSEIQRRRALLRGLERLFKRRKRSQRQGGSGYWLGLQHAFILGLARDSSGSVDWDRETTILDEIIGLPFYAVISPAARNHYRRMVRALQIDLIFIEDGVTFRRLVRVLRTMFEIYDMHGGKMPAREHHFSGLPGVRVILHEFEMNQAQAHGRANYPEPDYEEIGHARILHVFRDRGESAERDEQPVDADWTPIVSGV